MNRPGLTKTISVKDFESYYWLKEELTDFCKQNGLSTTGGKLEIKERILIYLKTGKIVQPQKQVTSSSGYTGSEAIPTLDTVITKNYRNSEVNREFFKQVIGPGFKFNVAFMNFFKENVGKTYRDAVEEYHRIQNSKKDKSSRTVIGKQFEFNQYFRDFFADPINKGKTRKDAITCWNYKKSLPVERKYSREDLSSLS